MRLDTIIVADAAAQAGGKLSILGAWTTRLTPKTFPWSEPSLSVIVRAFPEDEDLERDHVVGIEIEGPDGPIGAPSTFHIATDQLRTARAEAVPGEQQSLTLTLTMIGASFPRAGLYHVIVRIDNAEAGRYPLPVVESTEGT